MYCPMNANADYYFLSSKLLKRTSAMKGLFFILSLLLGVSLIGCHVKRSGISNPNGLKLYENSFGNLRLDKNTTLTISSLKSSFENLEITKSIAETDGPSITMYSLGSLGWAQTANQESATLHKLWIGDTRISDQYGIQIRISTEHYHIYLHEANSNIVYEMSIGDYSGPDKWSYSEEHLKHYNSRVLYIGWVSN
jgi:hypothetical protein